MSASRSSRGATSVIFWKELKELLRDRRAVFFAFVLPVFLYPLLFFLMGTLPRLHKSKVTESELSLGVSGAYQSLVPFLTEERLDLRELCYETEYVREGALDVFAHFEQSPEQEASLPEDAARNLDVTVYFKATSSKSSEGRRRVVTALQRYESSLIEDRFARQGVRLEPGRLARSETRDVATAEDQSGAKLGRLLPLLLVLLLITGGSFAAIDLVAGEKERGTLETLYLHPVEPRSIVRGKFAVVLVVSFISVFLNYAGMILGIEFCTWVGLGLGDDSPLPMLLPPVRSLALIFLLLTPFAVFTSSVLLTLSAYSRSFREAQTYLLPLTLICLVAVFLGLAPQVKLGSILAIVPIANVALGIREALIGTLRPVPYLVALVTSCLYAGLALRQAVRLLQREEIVLGLRSPVVLDRIDSERHARRALLFGCGMLLFVYYVGILLQSWSVWGGLVMTLWGVVLLPALAYPFVFRVPVRRTLGLVQTPLRNYVLAVVAVPLTGILSLAYMQLQDQFLPMPNVEVFFPQIEELSPWVVFLLLALSPGICEELLWRGAFQGELTLRRRPVRTVLTVGFFFGLFHLNIYRLIPTAIAGSVLATVRHRAGSTYPCMLLHCVYNASLMFVVHLTSAKEKSDSDPDALFLDEEVLGEFVRHPVVWIIAGVLLALVLSRMRVNDLDVGAGSR